MRVSPTLRWLGTSSSTTSSTSPMDSRRIDAVSDLICSRRSVSGLLRNVFQQLSGRPKDVPGEGCCQGSRASTFRLVWSHSRRGASCRGFGWPSAVGDPARAGGQVSVFSRVCEGKAYAQRLIGIPAALAPERRRNPFWDQRSTGFRQAFRGLNLSRPPLKSVRWRVYTLSTSG